MDMQLEIGRVWGIPIRLHVSWLLIFGLVTWSLAGGFLPAEYPGWSPPAYWLVAAVTALCFFASILLHELGHSWVARRNGAAIQDITLFVFGGMARITREPTVPAVELRVAIAGPVTSLALGLLFAVVAWAGRELAPLAAPAVWLARINVMVALFNLVPGFPLDGGRVLRALLWRQSGSYERATRTAAFTGQLIAAGMIAFGLVSTLGGNVLGGAWMMLIGWFLQSAAARTTEQANLRMFLRGVTVAQAMTRAYARVAGDVTLDALVRDEVLGAGQRCFLVTEDGRLRGLLTLHEVRAVPRDLWSRTRVADVMAPAEKLHTVADTDDLHDALQRMDDAGVAQLPVLSGDALAGLVGREEILHYIRVRSELGF
jgi:Zn-dependent protease/predicted transcriptional regulator